MMSESEYPYEYFTGVDTTDDMSTWEDYEDCIGPSLKHIYNYIKTVLWYTLVFRMSSYLAKRYRDFQFVVHIVSIVCGNLVLISMIGTSMIYCIIFNYCSTYILIVLFRWRKNCGRLGYWMGLLCLSILTACEIFEWNPSAWQRIRGIQMIATMKIVSLAFDLDTSMINAKSRSVKVKIEPTSCLGYLFCPANCLLGPWTTFEDYMSTVQGIDFIDSNNITSGIINLVASILFLLASNCFVSDAMWSFSSKWLAAYRDAFSFRCSHYFVSFLSQLSMVIGGFTAPENSANYSEFLGYKISNPIAMEFPRSLTDVVINWNFASHYWLKHYVFRIFRRKCVALALFATYIVSALLHGMNTKMAAVLLSLALFSMVEHNLRLSLAKRIDACVLAKPCKNCDHMFKRSSLLTLFTNGFFSAISIVHLAFLGSIIYSSPSSLEEDIAVESTWLKWSELNYISYWICFGCWVSDQLIKI